VAGRRRSPSGRGNLRSVAPSGRANRPPRIEHRKSRLRHPQPSIRRRFDEAVRTPPRAAPYQVSPARHVSRSGSMPSGSRSPHQIKTRPPFPPRGHASSVTSPHSRRSLRASPRFGGGFSSRWSAAGHRLEPAMVRLARCRHICARPTDDIVPARGAGSAMIGISYAGRPGGGADVQAWCRRARPPGRRRDLQLSGRSSTPNGSQPRGVADRATGSRPLHDRAPSCSVAHSAGLAWPRV